MRLALAVVVLCASVTAEAAAAPDSLQTPAPGDSVLKYLTKPDSTLAPLAQALSGPAPRSNPAEPDLTVHAGRLTRPLSLDGILNEPEWQVGPAVTRFLQRDPVENAQPSERTEVRVLYDDDAIYVGARMYDAHPDSILARLVRRDTDIAADRFTLFLDPFHDKRSGYYFGVNAAGVLYDGTLFNDSWDDNSWDGVWEGKAHRDEQGWTVEMRVPYSQMRFEHKERCVWGIDFRRDIMRKSESVYLVIPPKKESGFVSRFPDLVGLDGVRAGGSIELLPYVTAKAEYLVHDAGDPFNDGSKYTPAGGADLRMGVGGNLTLNATVNPDFGQVEVDPAVVNLSDVESFFQEKRPFFVENSRVFNFGNEGANDYWSFNWPEPLFFYSRRVGRTPEGDVPDSTFTDVPQAVHILGAAKLTGKLAPGWNFGTLHAVTGKEFADLYGSGVTSSALIEPLTYYGVVRTQREFAGMRNGLGFMTSLVARNLDDPMLHDQLNRTSLQAGLDGWHFLDKKQNYVISGWAMTSLVSGTAARITDVQQNSLHYFQRPDATSFSVDPTATSLFGHGVRLWLNKQNGRVLLNTAAGYMSPKFDVNDMGFQTRADVINAHFGTGYQWTDPVSWRKYANVLGALFQARNFDNDIVSEGVWAKTQIEFVNNYSWWTTFSYNPETVNNRRTRGGPLTLNLPTGTWSMYLDTDGKKKLFYFIQGTGQQSQTGSRYYMLNPGLEWKPVSSLSVRMGPMYERIIEDAQYVDTQDDAALTATYGERYLFANLDQTSLSGEFRINWAFTPKLSLQTYVQPLVSSGRYSDYKELARPRSYDWNRYDPAAITVDQADGTLDPDGAGPAQPVDIPDFDVRSLRGNAILRWEYLPGSTLFLVWTQQRSADGSVGSFDLQGSMTQLANAPTDNVFLAKITYYLNR